MADSSTCTVGLTNTGQSCVEVLKVTNRLIIVPTFDDTGTKNSIDLTATLDSAYFAALVNQTDSSKRWYPLPAMKNIEDTRDASLMQNFDDGSKVFIQQGIRSFKGLILAKDAPPQMVGKIESMRGVSVSAFYIDKFGNCIGKWDGNDTTKLYPIELQSETIDVIFGKTTDKTIQQIAMMFDLEVTERDKDIRAILGNEMTYNLNDLKGLIDVYSRVTSYNGTASLTDFTVELYTDGGTLINPTVVKGLLAPDFVSSDSASTSKIFNETQDADVSITVAENPAGVYTFTYSSQADQNYLILKPVLAGFDFTAVQANKIKVVD